MKQWIGAIAVVFIVALTISGFHKESEGVKESQSLTLWDWEFRNEGAKEWIEVSLPHDWSIQGTFGLDHGSDWQSGFLPAGVGYYKRMITLDDFAVNNQRIIIEFEGVYQNSSLYVNDHLVGTRPNGYVSFWYDITPFVHAGENLLTVKVDHSEPLSGRWYTGSGIYRPVHLHQFNKTHVGMWSPYIYTEGIKDNRAFIKAEYEIEIDDDLDKKPKAEFEVYDSKGEQVFKNSYLTADGRLDFDFSIKNPDLWSADSPNLYTVKLTLKNGSEVLDVNESTFGIRTIEVSPENGLFVNGEPIKIKGVCMHHGAGSLGAAVPVPVLHRRLKLLKEMGCNAIRTSHNPFAPAFYNMCDSMGFMVMNEAFDGWEQEKAEDDYGLYFEDWWRTDLTDFVKRDRNHPSVVFWSLGNEVQKPTAKTQKELIDLVKSLDQTRPITQGGLDPTRGMKESGTSFQLDVKGFNGDGEEKNAFEEYHKRNPSHPVIGTEVPHTYQTRGVYRTKTHWRRRDFPAPWEIASGTAGTMKGLVGKIFPIEDLTENEVFPEEKQTQYYQDGLYKTIDIKNEWEPYLYYQSSYDNATVRSSARHAWQRAEELPFVMGEFRWTGFDYLGETNGWPSRFANFGIIDICGFPKDHFYLYQSLWSDEPSLHILPHWTHSGKEGVEIPVVVYTNCDSVELFLNDQSLGTQSYEGEQLVWLVPYEAGELRAVAHLNGKIEKTTYQRTAEQPHHLDYELTASKDLKGDVICQVELSVKDKNGVEVPYAENALTFNLQNAIWLGADNGDPLDLTAPRSSNRKAFRGKAFCVFSSNPDDHPILEIQSAGLEPLVIDHLKPM